MVEQRMKFLRYLMLIFIVGMFIILRKMSYSSRWTTMLKRPNLKPKMRFFTRSKQTFSDKYNLLRNESEVPFEVCNTFKYSPADWTLYELARYNHSLENTTCNNLYESLLEDEIMVYKKYGETLKRANKRVKWIVHTDGAITSLGCTKYTRECEPGPFYDYKRQMRIDMPPCCRRKFMQTLEQVSNHLNANNASYMIVGGYVISYVRSKGILHYDEDIDLVVDWKHWKTGIFKDAMNVLTKKFGFHQTWRGAKRMSLEFSKTNGNGLGMWAYEIDSKNLFNFDESSSPKYDGSIMVPPKMVMLNNVKTKMPHDSVAYLNKTYKEWKSEVDCKKKDGNARKCI
eukprot:TCONS_00015557-protein